MSVEPSLLEGRVGLLALFVLLDPLESELPLPVDPFLEKTLGLLTLLVLLDPFEPELSSVLSPLPEPPKDPPLLPEAEPLLLLDPLLPLLLSEERLYGYL